jgi:hypothetical protein
MTVFFLYLCAKNLAPAVKKKIAVPTLDLTLLIPTTAISLDIEREV